MKKHSLLFTLILVVGLNQVGWGQALLIENFDYTAGDNITAHGWTAHSSGGTQPITVNSSGLTYSGYLSSGIGNAALSDNTGEDDNKTFTSQTSGSVYVAFMAKVTTAAAGYFFHVGQSTIGSTFRGKVFMDASHFGVSVGSNTGTYASSTFTTGTTYFIVLKYEIVSGTTNDKVSLFVFDSSFPSSEPGTPTIGPLTDATQTDLTNVGSIAIRQYSSTQNILIDGIRVATTWSDAAAASGVIISQLSGGIAPSPLAASATNKAILGYSLSAPTGAPDFTDIDVDFTTDPSTRFTNAKLVKSTTNDYSTGTLTDLAAGTITGTQFQFTGFTETLSSSNTYYFVVADVLGTVNVSTPATTPSFSDVDLTISGSISATTITGTAYSFSANPLITLTGSLTSFAQTGSTPSDVQTYTVTGANLSADVIITPPVNFQISSNSGTDWITNPTTITLTQASGSVSATISVRMNATATGTASASITHTSTGSNDPSMAVTGLRTDNFYPLSSSNLEVNTNWGLNTDGSGTNPPNFTTDGQIFVINKSNTIGANWVVSGTSAKIVVGDGSAVTFTIPDAMTVTGTIDLSANGTLTLQNATYAHTYGTVNSASTVNYDGTAAQSITQMTYGNLTLSSAGTKTFAGNTTTVSGNLIFNNCTIDAPGASPFATISLSGNLTYIGSVTNPADANSITLNMAGSSLQTITGNGNTARFFRITVNNSTGVALSTSGGSTNALVGNASGGGLTFTAGNLTTNSNTVTLFNSTGSSVLTEAISKYLIGNLSVTKAVTSGVAQTFGGIGFALTAAAEDLGNVTVTRVSGSHITLNSNTGINRYWKINPTNALTVARDLTISWIADDDNGKTLTSVQAWKSTDDFAAIENASTFGVVSDVSSTRSITTSLSSLTNGVNTSFTVSQSNAPLPVELTSFSANVNTHTRATLTWKTATEVNNYGFEVERSNSKTQNTTTELVWSKVGFVNGAGNSNSPKEYSFTDKSATAGKYLYRLKQLDNDGQYSYSKEVEVDLGTPTAFALEQNYPNPFNPTTSMQYSVSNKQFVTIKVFDMLGREVAILVNGEKEPGTYTAEFATTGLASGTYIYRMQAGEFVQTKKMVVLK